MKFFSRFPIFLVAYFLSLIASSPVHAQEEFSVNYNTAYIVDNAGSARVAQNVTLSNKFSKIYANSYSLTLEGKIPENISAEQDGQNIPISLDKDDSKLKITINFPDAVVGRGKSRNFVIHYAVPNFATRNGQVWEMSIPKLASPENMENYILTLTVPQSFGSAAYISPQPRSTNSLSQTQSFSFQKDDLIKAGVVAAFGEFQVYSFNLAYHLENPYSKTGETEIALPPDTAFQRVYYETLSPRPLRIYLDEDGNWMAKYRLGGNQKLNVSARVTVQVFAHPQSHYLKVDPDKVDYYFNSTDYWQSQDPEIMSLAQALRTPRSIYNFVVGKLNYDYSRVQENVIRLGAKQALSAPDRAICMEFTDLFVALSRAAGIPAREVNGYAYTINPQVQPLSLVADVLHSWPEYWDSDRQTWKPVDPTWEDTTGGIDFFDKFDLSHITFAIHGKSATEPLPAGSYKFGSTPQKDVELQFGQLPPLGRPEVKIEPVSMNVDFFSSSVKISLKFSNPGQTALYETPVAIQGLVVKGSESFTLPFLAPFDSTTREVLLRMPFFPGGAEKIVILARDSSLEYNIPLGQVYLLRFALLFGGILFVLCMIFALKHLREIYSVAAHLKKRFGND